MAVCAVFVFRARKTEAAHYEHPKIEWSQRLLWVALAALPSSLLLGVTSFLTTNIAPIPLLWVIPLSIYLVTFILAFARRQLVSAKVLGRLAPLLAIPLALMIILESNEPIGPISAVHLATFFVLAWMCHARLNESRPSVGGLTEFFVWISLGGVIGGIFNAIIAPLIFKSLAEYPLALVLAVMLRPQISGTKGKRDYIFPALVGVATLTGAACVKAFGIQAGTAATMATAGVPLILCIFAMDRPVRFGLCLGIVIFIANLTQSKDGNTVILRDRSFFGTHVVAQSKDGRMIQLLHGNTRHGMQDRENPRLALTYYHPSGPIGHVFNAFSGPLAKKDVALVGMGVGSLASYGEPGQHMTFFEIDPVVRRVTTNPNYFTFIRDSRATVDIVMGDARLTLSEQPNGKFGLIVLDAFSSDAIPVHLLTREAFQMYVAKLAPNGVIAVHLSNRYLELEPVISAVAKSLRLQAKSFTDGVTIEERESGKNESTWAILARNESDFGPLNSDSNWGELETWTNQRPWTDDYSNVLGVFRTDQ
jgi:hypothetical protein